MKEIDAEKLWNIICPKPVAMVTCTDAKGKPNAIVLTWHMHTSFNPPLVAISVGKTRYSHALLSDAKEFVYVVPAAEQASDVLYCGTHSGRNVDKFANTKFKTKRAKFVSAPLIEDAVANMECKIISQHESGDHTIFIGEVLAAYANESKKALYDFGLNKLRSLD